MLPYTDTHAHLSLLAERGIDPIARIKELAAAGFGSVMDVGTGADDLPGRLAAFSSLPNVRFTAGIWPGTEAIRERSKVLAALRAAIDRADKGLLVAVGECGLDRHWNKADDGADLEGELELFVEQVLLARELGLPIVIHSRDAAEETADALASVPGTRGVVHCFSYGKEEARRFLDLGLHVSFSGTVTYRNAAALREAAAFVPEDRLLLETDAPYLAPRPFRGRSAEPGMIERTYDAVAAARGITPQRLAETVAANAATLFGLPMRS
jgi:TatD DNase family protein